MIIFIDGIKIYSRFEDEYITYLRIAMEILSQYQLYAKFLKCEFGLTCISFLGHMMRCASILLDPHNIGRVLL